MDKEELKYESENAIWFYRVSFGGSWEDFDTLEDALCHIVEKQKKGMYCTIRHLAEITDTKYKENDKTTTNQESESKSSS